MQTVRQNTRQFLDVNHQSDGYDPLLGCISGSDHGTMGVHYVNPTLVNDGQIDAPTYSRTDKKRRSPSKGRLGNLNLIPHPSSSGKCRQLYQIVLRHRLQVSTGLAPGGQTPNDHERVEAFFSQ